MFKFDAHDFYKNRFSEHLKETSRYLKYIFNGHMAFAILFFISASAYYYQQWLTQLPESFPTAWIIGIIFGLLASYSPVRTLLKEPDLVFLIPAEKKMAPYFRNTLIYSFVIQIYLIFLAAAAFGPLYFATYDTRDSSIYLLTILAVVILKVMNLLANWWMLKERDGNIRAADITIRTVLNVAIFYFMVSGDGILMTVSMVLFLGVVVYAYMHARKKAGIAWDLLIEKDQNRMQSFYRMANMFAEVPHLKNRVRKRQWLVELVTRSVPVERKRTYDYLYRITFVRSGDYLGMYVRLIVIGGIFIWLMPNQWMQLAFGVLFVYLSTFQMMPVYDHFRANIWLDLYPVADGERRVAALKIIRLLSVVHVMLYALLLVLLGDWLTALLMLVIGMPFVVLFIRGYMEPRMK